MATIGRMRDSNQQQGTPERAYSNEVMLVMC